MGSSSSTHQKFLSATRKMNLTELRHLVSQCQEKDQHFDIDSVQNSHGHTCLVIAVQNSDLDTIKYLVETLKANVDATDENGKSVLQHAAGVDNADGALQVVRYLMETGNADWRHTDNNMNTCLMNAALNGTLETVQYLSEYCGASLVFAKNKWGNSCLSFAVMGGNLNVLKFLMEKYGMDANERSKTGRTPLMWAVEKQNMAITKYLLSECGAVVDARDHNGDTPLSLVEEPKNAKLKELLLGWKQGGPLKSNRAEAEESYDTVSEAERVSLENLEDAENEV